MQYLAGHNDPRTTRIYDQQRKAMRNIVERIWIWPPAAVPAMAREADIVLGLHAI